MNLLVEELDNQIQCVVSGCTEIKSNRKVEFGKAQTPGFTDYADGVDVMNFLSKPLVHRGLSNLK